MILRVMLSGLSGAPREAVPPATPQARAQARWIEEYADTRMGEVFIWRLFNERVIKQGEQADQGSWKSQQEQQGAAQPFDLAGKAVGENLLLDNKINELWTLPAGFDASHFPRSTFREQVLMCPGVKGYAVCPTVAQIVYHGQV